MIPDLLIRCDSFPLSRLEHLSVLSSSLFEFHETLGRQLITEPLDQISLLKT